MQPKIVMPMNDPRGVIFPHLKAITPTLKTLFARSFVSVSPATRNAQPEHFRWLENEAFYDVLYHEMDMPVGDDFLALYRHAATASHPDEILHLCFPDRIAFALQTEHRDSFADDINVLQKDQTPIIFHRSQAAWDTHPVNYRDIEQMVTAAGEHLFKKSFDFAWCHLAAPASFLVEILPRVKSHDLTIEAEIVLLLSDKIKTKAVDWLAWEDPFIFGRNAQELKREREQSQQETRKRLSYVIPMLHCLYQATEEDCECLSQDKIFGGFA